MTSIVRVKDKIFVYFRRRFSERPVKMRSLRIFILSVLLVLSVVYAINDHYQKIKKRKDAVRAFASPLRILIEEGNKPSPLIFISSYEGSYLCRGVILCVWWGGRIVWSEDQLRGGPPYFEGKIPWVMVTKVLDEIEDAGFFDDPFLNVGNLAVSPLLTIVALIYKNKALCMEAAHNIGKAGLQESEDYSKSYFRIRELLDSLIPTEGEVVDFNYKIVDVYRWKD